MLSVLSKVITLLPAKSRSNKAGAIAANEAMATVPLLPALAGTAICNLLYCAVAFEPVGQMMMSKLRAFEPSKFLKSISSTILALVSPVTNKVSVLIAKPDAKSIAGYLPVSVANDN